MPPNRIVALLTPVIAIAAGAAATWLAGNIPGMEASAGQLQAVFVAALAAVLAPAAQWLHGHQKYEAHQQALEQAALAADAPAPAVAFVEDAYDPYEDEDDYDDEYESALAEAEPSAALGA